MNSQIWAIDNTYSAVILSEVVVREADDNVVEGPLRSSISKG
jgi:hypothetical protein